MKTNIIKKIYTAFPHKAMMALTVCALLLTACDDDDSGEGSTPITVDKVFLEDVNSTVPDREVTFARLGQLIRIEGSGFKGLRHIYINGYDTYFNNALLTDNNVWVTLNASTPVDKADEDVRNTIQLVKDNTSTTYSFIIRASAPSITSIDNTLPQSGETVTVYGANLQEITAVTLPGGTVITSDIVSDDDGEWFTFVMPSGETEGGSLTSEGANGTAISAPLFNDNNCYIINFDGLGVLGSWSATYSSDDLVDDPLGSGRGKVCMIVPQSALDEGGIKAGSKSLLWATAGNDETTDDWTRMTDYIPASTPLSNMAMQFDVYVPDDWEGTGQIEFSLQNNLSTYGWGSSNTQPSDEYTNTAAVWVPWLNDDDGSTSAYNTLGRWVTVTFPLTNFGNYSEEDDTHTFQDLIDDRNAASYRNFIWLLVNSDIEYSDDLTIASGDFSQKIYIDNLRIVNNTPVEVSDFDD